MNNREGDNHHGEGDNEASGEETPRKDQIPTVAFRGNRPGGKKTQNTKCCGNKHIYKQQINK